MKSMREWGHDVFRVEANINEVIQVCKVHKLFIYDIWIKDEFVYFCASLVDRRTIVRAFYHVEYIQTTGIFGFVLQQIKKPRRLVAILSSVATLLVCSNLVFQVNIRGSSQTTEQNIRNFLLDEQVKVPMALLSTNEFYQMEQKLKENFFSDIEWINFSRIGSAYFIDYVPRKKAAPVPMTKEPLVAYKAGVVARFELKRGVKLVKEHDYVNIGDVLVTADVLDSNNQMQSDYVDGRVFAYTSYVIESKLKKNSLSIFHQSFGFFQLLFDCRGQIAKELQEDESIQTENILLFHTNQGRIEMKIHYTLYEEITRP